MHHRPQRPAKENKNKFRCFLQLYNPYQEQYEALTGTAQNRSRNAAF